MADEPETQQYRHGDQRSDDLVLRQGGKELAYGYAGHAQQNEANIAGDDRRGLWVAIQVQRHQVDECAARHQQQDLGDCYILINQALF